MLTKVNCVREKLDAIQMSENKGKDNYCVI